MKSAFCTITVLFFACLSMANAQGLPKVGDGVITCVQQNKKWNERYTATVYSDKTGTGFAILTKGGDVIMTSVVSTRLSTSTQQYATGEAFDLFVDREDMSTGSVNFRIGGISTIIYFEENECTLQGHGWAE